MKKSNYLLVTLIVVAADQWSKWWIERFVEPYSVVPVVTGHFQLIFAKNTGIAFGLFPSEGQLLGTMILAALGLFALTLVGFLFLRTPADQPLLLLALALVLGGALGNLTDRVLLGEVTDFLDAFWGSKHFPTFNIADSAISVGIAFLAWDSLLGRDPLAASESEPENPSGLAT